MDVEMQEDNEKIILESDEEILEAKSVQEPPPTEEAHSVKAEDMAPLELITTAPKLIVSKETEEESMLFGEPAKISPKKESVIASPQFMLNSQKASSDAASIVNEPIEPRKLFEEEPIKEADIRSEEEVMQVEPVGKAEADD